MQKRKHLTVSFKIQKVQNQCLLKLILKNDSGTCRVKKNLVKNDDLSLLWCNSCICDCPTIWFPRIWFTVILVTFFDF